MQHFSPKRNIVFFLPNFRAGPLIFHHQNAKHYGVLKRNVSRGKGEKMDSGPRIQFFWAAFSLKYPTLKRKEKTNYEDQPTYHFHRYIHLFLVNIQCSFTNVDTFVSFAELVEQQVNVVNNSGLQPFVSVLHCCMKNLQYGKIIGKSQACLL